MCVKHPTRATRSGGTNAHLLTYNTIEGMVEGAKEGSTAQKKESLKKGETDDLHALNYSSLRYMGRIRVGADNVGAASSTTNSTTWRPTGGVKIWQKKYQGVVEKGNSLLRLAG